MRRRWKDGEERRRRNGADEPGGHAREGLNEAAMAEEARRPGERNGHEGNDGEAQKLHQEIRDHSAGPAEQVRGIAINGTVEGGIGGRPGGKGGAERHHRREQGEAQKLHDAVADKTADRPRDGAVIGVDGMFECHEPARLRRTSFRAHKKWLTRSLAMRG